MRGDILSLLRPRRSRDSTPRVRCNSLRSVTSQPASRTSSYAQIKQPRSPTITRTLPQELILQVLLYLVPSVHTAAYRLPLENSNSAASSATREVERSQRYLHWASQVCRDWHAVASELLYATPFLTTTRRVELFTRTLIEVPELTRFVKDVYVPLSNAGNVSSALGWILGRKSAHVQQELLVKLLTCCPTMEALSLRHSVQKSLACITPIDCIIRCAGIANNLKRLTVHGSSFEARWHPQFCIVPNSLADLSLPRLEVLCLRGIYILPTFKLPPLPKLHTLQLVENYYFPTTGPRDPLFSQKNMPELRMVEIFRNHFPEESHGPVFDVSCFTQLESLHFLQDEHCLEVTRWADADSQVRHLALGFLQARDHVDLACWRFPDALESLTLLLRDREGGRADRGAIFGRDNGADVLDGVLRCLELNLQETTFRKLSVLAKFPGARDADARLARERAVDDIRLLCTERGVEFNYNLDGEFSMLHTTAR